MKQQQIVLPNGRSGIILLDDDNNQNPTHNPYVTSDNHRRDPSNPGNGQFIYVSHQAHYRSPQASHEYQHTPIF